MAIKKLHVHGFHKIDDLDVDTLTQKMFTDLFHITFEEIREIETRCKGKYQRSELHLPSQLGINAKEITINDKNLDFSTKTLVDLHKLAEYNFACMSDPVINEKVFKESTPEKIHLHLSIARIGNHRYGYYEISQD